MEEDAADMQTVVLLEPGGATAEVSLHGGHVSSWKNREGEELLYVSPGRAVFQGIQVYFPKFRGTARPKLFNGLRSSRKCLFDQNTLGIPRPSSESSVPNGDHSVDRVWTSVVTMPDGSPSEDYIKNAGPFTPVYTLRQKITLGSNGVTLTSDFWVTNIGRKPFKFKFALLNHLPVSDNDEVKFRLEGIQKLDNDDFLRLEGELDTGIDTAHKGSIIFRDTDLYLVTPTTISITKHGKQQTFVLKRKNLPELVVWNPRDESTSILARLGLSCLSCNGATNDRDDEYKHVLSVGGAVNEEIKLRPNVVWHARQEISVVPSHHNMGQIDPISS